MRVCVLLTALNVYLMTLSVHPVRAQEIDHCAEGEGCNEETELEEEYDDEDEEFPPRPPGWYVGHERIDWVTDKTMNDYVVAGVNLADYRYDGSHKVPENVDTPPFELFDSFDISDQIMGEESWWDLIRYRQLMERPINSFYYDKVALKRWLPTIGLDIPKQFAVMYKTDITNSGNKIHERKAIANLLPKKESFVSKPSHMSFTNGVWLVNHDYGAGKSTVSSTTGDVVVEDGYAPSIIANSLADHLYWKPLEYESWTLNNVHPGIIVEEKLSDLDCGECPPIGFNVFVIWGRVWVGEMNFVAKKTRYCAGHVHRNGTMADSAPGFADKSPFEQWVPWLDWSRVVSMAERLGANKDMLRVDVLAGLPCNKDAPGTDAPAEEKEKAVRYVISEISFHPTTIFDSVELREEGARLWIAGYKMGNYKTVPNSEVPQVFAETGQFPLPSFQSGEEVE